MKFLAAIAALGLALALQAGLARLWPESARYVDMMLVPVVWYSISVSQRSGMLVGCAAGLLHDAWFQTGVFGINGFKKTALGWLLGGVGSRFDVNRHPGRFLFGALAAGADSLIDVGLRRLMDQTGPSPQAAEIAIRALVTGLLVVGAFAAAQRIRQRDSAYPAHRRRRV